MYDYIHIVTLNLEDSQNHPNVGEYANPRIVSGFMFGAFWTSS